MLLLSIILPVNSVGYRNRRYLGLSLISENGKFMKRLLLTACMAVTSILSATPHLDLYLSLDNLDELIEVEKTAHFDDNNRWFYEQPNLSVKLILEKETEYGVLIKASVFNNNKELLAEPTLEAYWEEEANLGVSNTAGRLFIMSITAHKGTSTYEYTGAQGYAGAGIGADYYERGEEMFTDPECSESHKSIRCQAGLMILTQVEEAIERHKFVLNVVNRAVADNIRLADIEETADYSSFLKAYLSTYLEHFSPEEIIQITENTISRLEILNKKYPHNEIKQQFIATFTAPKQ